MALALYILAAVMFAVAAFLPQLEPYRVRFIAGGLFVWVLVPLFTAAGALH
jgi:hypothetical protein